MRTGYKNGSSRDSFADLFAERLNYNKQETGLSGTLLYNGNITSQIWNNTSKGKQAYLYSYDGLNRLTSSDYKTYTTTWTDPTSYEEKGITYDYNGNIKTLTRTDNSGTTTGTNGAAYTYDYTNTGNQLNKINGGTAYVYDKNGNMISDGRTGNSVTYNLLNLPATISQSTDKITYTYTAAGEKLQKSSLTGGVTNNDYYMGSFVYNSSKGLNYILFEEGVVKQTTNGYSWEYNLKDHLGNTRVVFSTAGTSPKVEQATDYYPFGQSFYVANATNNGNKYLYNGKEQQQDVLGGSSLNWYDYGARFYDPQIGRWHSVDPLAALYFSWSPYNYCINNPLKYNDPKGMNISSTHLNPYISSTHLNPFGEVVAVYDDGDLGVYQHSWAELNGNYATNDADAKGGKGRLQRKQREKVGETVTWDSFTDGNKNPIGYIDLNSYEAYDFLAELDKYLNNSLKSNYGIIVRAAYGFFGGNKDYWDFKSRGDIYRGSRINKGGVAVFMSARDVGNFAAGYVAKRTGMGKMDYMLTAGGFQVANNNIWLFMSNSIYYKHKAFSKGYPSYGEGYLSNKAQRLGYENIRKNGDYNQANHDKIMSDK